MTTHGATPEGTRQYHQGHRKFLHPDKVRRMGGLTLSALAVGTYLGAYDEATDRLYEESIAAALQSGCNFIDTAINYRCQRSERSVGKAIAGLIAKKKIRRDQVVVATKGGFIPFDSQPPSNLEAYIREKYIETGLAPEEEIVSSCHCLHPRFIQHQIDSSLANLGLETIDIYYLHNPETQLSATGPERLHERLINAFEVLEQNVAGGKIAFYGLATWSAFREPEGAMDNLSLTKAVELAQQAGGRDHHFRAIQLPYSLAMLEAISVHGQQGEGQLTPILPAASALGISVMTSAPLLQGQILKLPEALTGKMPGDLTLPQKALQFVSSTPGVTSALVGMKQSAHVGENLAVLAYANWDLPTLQKICDVLTRK